MMLDDTRCGLDTSSFHRATSMDNYKVEKFKLISCHQDTSKEFAVYLFTSLTLYERLLPLTINAISPVLTTVSPVLVVNA